MMQTEQVVFLYLGVCEGLEEGKEGEKLCNYILLSKIKKQDYAAKSSVNHSAHLGHWELDIDINLGNMKVFGNLNKSC